MSRHSLIRIALDALSLTHAPKWLPAPSDAAGFIVTLHHVGPERDAAFQPNGLLSVTPEFLDRFLGHFIARGWRFVSVDEMARGAAVARRRTGAASPSRWMTATATISSMPGRSSGGIPCPSRSMSAPASATARRSSGGRRWTASSRARIPCRCPAPRGRRLRRGGCGEKLKAFEVWKDWLTTEADELRQRVAIRELCADAWPRPRRACRASWSWIGTRCVRSPPTRLHRSGRIP